MSENTNNANNLSNLADKQEDKKFQKMLEKLDELTKEGLAARVYHTSFIITQGSIGIKDLKGMREFLDLYDAHLSQTAHVITRTDKDKLDDLLKQDTLSKKLLIEVVRASCCYGYIDNVNFFEWVVAVLQQTDVIVLSLRYYENEPKRGVRLLENLGQDKLKIINLIFTKNAAGPNLTAEIVTHYISQLFQLCGLYTSPHHRGEDETFSSQVRVFSDFQNHIYENYPVALVTQEKHCNINLHYSQITIASSKTAAERFAKMSAKYPCVIPYILQYYSNDYQLLSTLLWSMNLAKGMEYVKIVYQHILYLDPVKNLALSIILLSRRKTEGNNVTEIDYLNTIRKVNLSGERAGGMVSAGLPIPMENELLMLFRLIGAVISEKEADELLSRNSFGEYPLHHQESYVMDALFTGMKESPYVDAEKRLKYIRNHEARDVITEQ